MNPHPRSLATLPTRMWFGFISLVSTMLLVCLLASATNVKTQEPSWSATGSLGTARSGHTATLLANGKVLVVGGFNGCNSGCRTTGSAELYDPAAGTWSHTGNLGIARGIHTATLLPDGKVLVAGGSSNGADTLNSAELYDPVTGIWSHTGNLSTPRRIHTATLLPNGKVLVVGGGFGLNSAELYDTRTGTWSFTGNLNTGRLYADSAMLLPNGKVLVASGSISDSSLHSAEVYDPATETWSITGNLNTTRWYAHTATLLPNGQVLVAAGSSNGDDVLNSAELYDPATGTWSHTGNVSTARGVHTATLLRNGKVLVAGGFDYDYDALNSAELYDPAAGSWSVTDSLNTSRDGHTATLLANGKVLVAGGYGASGGSLNSAELYDPGDTTISTGPANFVFIITDDQDTELLDYMPRIKRLLADEGTWFTNTFVTTPQCCPSHVTILTGLYPHNSGVLNNWYDSGGGFRTFVDNGGDKSTIATWLEAAGYRTARFGKYLVEYEGTTYMPPGWSEWYAYFGSGKYFDYTLNENGSLVNYGHAESDYSTDVLTEKVTDFIGRTRKDKPFFIVFAPAGPHGDGVPNGPARPAPRHKGMFAGAKTPRPPSFNEADVSDKPSAISSLPLLTASQISAIDSEYQTRLESLQSVDEAVESIVNSLAAHGKLENTYLIFTSDNGYHLGQHRLRNGKTQVYEEDIRVPLLIRGPKVPAGATRDHLVVTIDFAPTIAKLAGIQPGHTVDGQSFADLFDDDPPSPKKWRKDFLVEVYRRLPPLGNGDAIRALRSLDGMLYAEYESGPTELYDLTQDPYQLESQHDLAPPGHLKKLSRRLAELATCAGDTCR